MNKASALSNCDIRSKLTNCGKYGTISAWAFAFDFPQNHKPIISPLSKENNMNHTKQSLKAKCIYIGNACYSIRLSDA